MAVGNPIKLGFKIVGILRIKVDIAKRNEGFFTRSRENQSFTGGIRIADWPSTRLLLTGLIGEGRQKVPRCGITITLIYEKLEIFLI